MSTSFWEGGRSNFENANEECLSLSPLLLFSRALHVYTRGREKERETLKSDPTSIASRDRFVLARPYSSIVGFDFPPSHVVYVHVKTDTRRRRRRRRRRNRRRRNRRRRKTKYADEGGRGEREGRRDTQILGWRRTKKK